jgi:ribokinase
MCPDFVITGRLSREYVLPPLGNPILDVAGGNLLYAAGGVSIWDRSVGLVGRVGEDYPRNWLRWFESYGLDTLGIRILPQALDLRSFVAYTLDMEPNRSNPVAHFARLGLPFPKALLGYQPSSDTQNGRDQSDPAVPGVTDVPDDYLNTSALHLCPMDITSQSRLLAKFKQGNVTTISLDPSASYMQPAYQDELRSLMLGITIFMPSQEELRGLFWGKTNDLWEMAEEIASFGCELIVIKCGSQGQLLYDGMGKHRWEIPAYPARVADPTGAGDSYCGGFLAGYRVNYDPLEAAMHGNVSASLNIEGSGPFYALDVVPGLARARLASLRDIIREV